MILLKAEAQRQIDDNLIVIRDYLKSKFPDYIITERSVPKLYHKFTVTNVKVYKSYKLKVDWSRLLGCSTPEGTRFDLNSDSVANWMIHAGEAYYYW